MSSTVGAVLLKLLREYEYMPILPFGPFTFRTRHGRVTICGLALIPLATGVSYIASRLLATDKAVDSPKLHPERGGPGGENWQEL